MESEKVDGDGRTLMKRKDESQVSQSVSVQEIERDLHKLWEQMAEATQVEDREPVMRSCVLNLMVYAPGERSVDEVGQIMAEVTTQHPSRIIVILPQHEADGPPLSAWVTTLCHLSAGGRKQVCCEQIMISAEGDGINQLPSLVRPLLVPDLPVVLWWRDVPSFESRVFKEMAGTSDRVIIDSVTLPDPEEGLVKLATLINQRVRWTAFSDLSWSRLTPWRVSVSGFFDIPDWRAHLARLNRVEIECTPDHADRHSIPSQAVLIASWLASRLKWRPTSKPQWSGEQAYHLGLASEHGPITIRIKTTPSTEGAKSGLNALRLVVESEPSARFVVSCCDDSSYLQTTVELAGTKVDGRLFPLGDQREAELVSKELEILGHDTVYEQALAFFVGVRIQG